MTPDFDTFEGYARDGNVVPVHKLLAADLETPVSAYLKLAAKSRYSFLLESVEGGEKIARYTFLGADPFLLVEARGNRVTLRKDGTTKRRRGNVFEILREITHEFQPAGAEGLPPFSAGAVGYAGYDLVRLIEPRVPAFRKDDLKTPDAVFMFFETLLAFDHVKHQIHVVANVRCDEWKGKLRKGLRRCLPPDRQGRKSAGPAAEGSVDEGLGEAAGSRVEHRAETLLPSSRESEGVYSRGRYFSGCAVAAARHEARR